MKSTISILAPVSFVIVSIFYLTEMEDYAELSNRKFSIVSVKNVMFLIINID